MRPPRLGTWAKRVGRTAWVFTVEFDALARARLGSREGMAHSRLLFCVGPDNRRIDRETKRE